MHVPFDGWGQAALNAGAATPGSRPTMWRGCSRPGADAIVMHSAMADAAMVAAFEACQTVPTVFT